MQTQCSFCLQSHQSQQLKGAASKSLIQINQHFGTIVYGHLSYKGLRILKHKNMVEGLPQIVDPSITCEACIKGNQHRTPIPKYSQWRATKKLGLVHADLCGPITLPSSSEKRYVLCFIDDFSRKA